MRRLEIQLKFENEPEPYAPLRPFMGNKLEPDNIRMCIWEIHLHSLISHTTPDNATTGVGDLLVTMGRRLNGPTMTIVLSRQSPSH